MKKIITLGIVLLGVIAYAQPSGSCTAGTTKLGTDGKLYGCVETNWRKLTENVVSNASIGATKGITQNVNGVVQAREQDHSVSQLNNIGFTPISVSDAPSHLVGKIFYSSAKKHFYQGVSGGLWHQIDNEVFTPSPKCLERIKDRNYGDGDHNFIYCAVQGPNGKKWLNLNLGAEYARESTTNNPNPYFNPEAQPTDFNDWKAFGSLFQDGRKADGHELVEYYHTKLKPSEMLNGYTNLWWYAYRKYPVTTTKQDAINSNHSFVFAEGSWISNEGNEDNLWDGTMLNNPCPNGYRVMNETDIRSLLVNDYSKIANGDSSQGFNSASIFYNKDYPNLKIMTAPLIESDRQNNISQLQISWTTSIANSYEFQSGTSTLWMLPNRNPDTVFYQFMYSYNNKYTPKDSFGWTKKYIPSFNQIENKAYHWVFDRGLYENSGSAYDFGYMDTSMYNSMAIRCVEQ